MEKHSIISSRLQGLPLDELRENYRVFLQTQNLARQTILTSTSDTFYLFRYEGHDTFWRVVLSPDFENDAQKVLLTALKQHSTVDSHFNISAYMSHLRRFRNYVLHTTVDGQPDCTKQVLQQSRGKEPTKKRIRSHRATSSILPKPSATQVEAYLSMWNTLENYRLQEDALNKLFFQLCPTNTNIEDILLKVSALNDFYSTNIYSTFPVAKHILALDIDERLMAGDISLVQVIQKVSINDTEKNFYSFATKYCSHHNPLTFPIYDSYVDKVLYRFMQQDHFADFRREDLKDYQRFYDILLTFRSFYGLEKYNLKEIDKYLWQLGKDFIPKNYGSKKKQSIKK